MSKVCILVVSHNNPTLTDSLCEGIIQRTKGVDYDLHVIETGSDFDKCSRYMTLWVKEKCRMTRGFNLLKMYADATSKSNYRYDAYHLFVNDAKFIDDKDVTSILYNQMKELPDCGQIHPYQQNLTHSSHPRLGKVGQSGVRKESFVEIICPMISAYAFSVRPCLLDNDFFYGWGLDYDIPYQLHEEGLRTYISDEVGIYHQAFTSYRDKHITKESLDQGEFMRLARENMNAGFVKKYGENWKRVLYEGIPEDVSKVALYEWLHQNDGFNLRVD